MDIAIRKSNCASQAVRLLREIRASHFPVRGRRGGVGFGAVGCDGIGRDSASYFSVRFASYAIGNNEQIQGRHRPAGIFVVSPNKSNVLLRSDLNLKTCLLAHDAAPEHFLLGLKPVLKRLNLPFTLSLLSIRSPLYSLPLHCLS